MNAIKGKTLILTGASRGIGRALALELAQSGVHLVLNARDGLALEEVVVQCRSHGIEVRSVIGNAAEARTVSGLLGEALTMGNFFGFIQVAGVLHPGPFLWELSEDHFVQIFEAGVMASYQLVRFAVPELLKQGKGVAVFFGSGAAEMSTPGIGAYSAAKAAEEHLVRQLAAEAPQITSFLYRPGVVETRMQQEARSAQGGAAGEVHRVFRGYKERGELISPEKAAQSLVRILMEDPRRFHGKVVYWRDSV